MSDSQVILNLGAGGAVIATDQVAGKEYQIIKAAFGGSGAATEVSTADPLPVQVLGTPALAADAATQTTLEAVRVLLAAGINVTVQNGTIAISAASLPLPTGAATQATLEAIRVLIAAGITVSGTVAVSNFPASQAVTGTFFQATQPVSVAATLAVKEARSATPVQSSPGPSTSSTSILTSNANRLGGTIFNEGAAICYVKLGATASITSYTVQIAALGYYEIPFGYTGAIDGITASGTAQLRVTEFTS